MSHAFLTRCRVGADGSVPTKDTAKGIIMMDVKEIWSRACARLESEMNPVVFKALIANNLTAMEQDGDTLVMRVTM